MRVLKRLAFIGLSLFFAPCVAARAGVPEYEHKSEAEIARMTPARRVDEWVGEQVHHRYDLDDEHEDLIKKYLLRDGLAALPRMIEIMDEYDPTRFREGEGRRGERFDACWLMLGYMDGQAVRLRASEGGRRAMASLESAIRRMRAAGYGREGQHDWPQHGRFELAAAYLEEAKGINNADEAIRDTFWVRHQVQMSDEELLAFSNFLVERDPTYPGWSGKDFIKDYTRINEAGNPARRHVMKKPERFYKAYLEFMKTKKTKQQ